jgi:hypothetical protein
MLARLGVRQPLLGTRAMGSKGWAQRPELGRTSTTGILNYVRVLMENEVMVFPRR